MRDDASGRPDDVPFAHSRLLQLTVRLDGTVVGASPAWARILGRGPEALVGTSLPDLLAEADRREVRRRFDALAAGRSEESFQARTHAPDGPGPLLDWFLALSRREGLVRIVATEAAYCSRDPHAACPRLRNEGLLASIPDLVFRLDGEGRILEYRGPSGTELYAAPDGPDGFLGRRLREVLPAEVAVAMEAAVREALEEGRVVELEYRLDLPEAGPRRYEARLARSGHDEVVAVARDVTGRYEAERLLREQRRDLEEFVDSTNFGTWKWNVQTGATEFNERWAEIVGYTLAELEPVSIETWLGLAHPDDLPASEAALEAHFAGETDFYDVECRMRHRSGRWVWVHDRGRVVTRTPDGAPEWMYGTHADITERRRMEAGLRDSHHLLSQAEEIAALGTWELAGDSGEVAWSDQVYRIFGLEPGQGVPPFPDVLEHVHPEDREALLAAFHGDGTATGPGAEAVEDLEYRVLRADTGAVRHVHSRARFQRDEEGRLIRAVGTTHDVTERVRAEETLRAREEEFRSLAENMQDVVVRLDVGGRHLFVNPAAACLMGTPPENLLGRTAREIGLPGPITEVYDRELPRVVASREPSRGTFTGGFHRSWDYVLIPEPGPEGGVCSVLGVFRDVTELVEAQQALLEMERRMLHAQRLESLGVLAGGIAHDFNNILTVVRGYSELVLEDLGTDHELAPELEAVLDGVAHAARLTRQMLQFSGGEATARAETEMGGLLDGLADLLHSSVPPGVELRIRRPDAPLRVMGAPEQLRQVVTNLVSNAAEAVDRGPGRIDVILREVPGGWSPPGRAPVACRALGFRGAAPRVACLEVRDDGCGMAPEILDHIFEPFFTTKFQGRGLGLAAVQGIVRGHEGALYVASEEGEGSAFHLLLPVLEEAPTGPEEGGGDGEEDTGARVLVVDDEAPLRRVLSAGLVRAGHRVLEAADGAEAVEVVERAAPDLVLLDLSMPGMDGVTCYGEIRRRCPGLPVVVMSGHAPEVVADRFVGEEPPPILSKPFSLSGALEAVEEHLASRVRGPAPVPGTLHAGAGGLSSPSRR
jgi:PAS domain S-box-containing protein